MKLQRARDLLFELSDGREFVIKSPTGAQVRRCAELDPADGEGVSAEQPDATMRRIFAQVEILTGGAITDEVIDFEEAKQIRMAIVAHFHGQNPADLLALLEVMEKLPKKKGRRDDLIQQIDEMSFELGVHLHCTPAETEERLPLVEASAMLNMIHERRSDEVKFQAALHGATM